MVEVRADAATYIEVWEPHTRYRDLYELVRRARTLRPDKPAILAAYLQPFSADRERSSGALTAFRLASAAIGASGGFHLIVGEGDAVLTEAYYPHYGRLDRAERAVVRRYADFAVRNTTRLHDVSATDVAWTHVGPTNDAITLHHPQLGFYGAGAVPDSLWAVARETGRETVVHLVNLRGVATDSWNVEQSSAPVPLTDVEVRVRIVTPPADAFVTVDGQHGAQLQPDDVVVTRLATEQTVLWRRPGWNFYDVLRRKLQEEDGAHAGE
jgi:dextranase